MGDLDDLAQAARAPHRAVRAVRNRRRSSGLRLVLLLLIADIAGMAAIMHRGPDWEFEALHWMELAAYALSVIFIIALAVRIGLGGARR